MQVDRLFARLSLSAAPFVLLLGVTPAAAQDAAETVTLEPLPIFKAVCQGDGAKLTRKTASEAAFATLPDPAQRALGKALGQTRAEAAGLGAPAAAAVPNTMYQINGSQFYLLVPAHSGAQPASATTLAESCVVLWQSAGDDDYLQARKVLLPGEASVPMYLRPNSSPNGFVFASTVTGQSRLTLATYGGWIALRSSATHPADPQKGN